MVGPMVGDAGTAGVATRSNRLHPTENIPMKAVTPLAAAVLALSLAACGPKAEQAADDESHGQIASGSRPHRPSARHAAPTHLNN